MKRFTGPAIALFIIGLIIYDVIAFIMGGQEATISFLIVTDWSRNYPMFTFSMGVVMGHFFWNLKPKGRIK